MDSVVSHMGTELWQCLYINTCEWCHSVVTWDEGSICTSTHVQKSGTTLTCSSSPSTWLAWRRRGRTWCWRRQGWWEHRQWLQWVSGGRWQECVGRGVAGWWCDQQSSMRSATEQCRCIWSTSSAGDRRTEDIQLCDISVGNWDVHVYTNISILYPGTKSHTLVSKFLSLSVFRSLSL